MNTYENPFDYNRVERIMSKNAHFRYSSSIAAAIKILTVNVTAQVHGNSDDIGDLGSLRCGPRRDASEPSSSFSSK